MAAASERPELPPEIQEAITYAESRHWHLCDSRYEAVNGESRRCDCGLEALLKLFTSTALRAQRVERQLQQPARTGCDDCLDARRAAEAALERAERELAAHDAIDEQYRIIAEERDDLQARLQRAEGERDKRGQCGQCDVPFTCAAICARTGEKIAAFQGDELLKAYRLGWEASLAAHREIAQEMRKWTGVGMVEDRYVLRWADQLDPPVAVKEGKV